MTDAADVIPKKRVKKPNPNKKKKQAVLEEVVTVEAQGVIPRAELMTHDACPPFIPDPKTERPEPEVIDMEEQDVALQTLLQLKSQPSSPLKDVQDTFLWCPFHERQLEERTTDKGPIKGQRFMICPEYMCCLILPQEGAEEYMKEVHAQLYAEIKNHWPLKCFCEVELTLKKSRSEKNPNRIYFTCRKKVNERCKYFQWGDIALTPKNREHHFKPKEEKKTCASTQTMSLEEILTNPTFLKDLPPEALTQLQKNLELMKKEERVESDTPRKEVGYFISQPFFFDDGTYPEKIYVNEVNVIQAPATLKGLLYKRLGTGFPAPKINTHFEGEPKTILFANTPFAPGGTTPKSYF